MPADDSAEKVGALCHRRSYQKAAIAAAENRQLRGRGVLVLDQPLACRDEVVEDVLLFVEHARCVPGFAELAAAAQVDLCHDAPALGKHDGVSRKGRRDVDIEAAIPG